MPSSQKAGKGGVKLQYYRLKHDEDKTVTQIKKKIGEDTETNQESEIKSKIKSIACGQPS